MVGGATPACTSRAAEVIGAAHRLGVPGQLPRRRRGRKLYENIFRAVSLALANEFADACGALSLDPIEVTLAAAPSRTASSARSPAPGVGGHCIPCDPHYLLWQLNAADQSAPLIEQAMKSIALRPERVIQRAAEVLAADGRPLAGARIIVIGASYKPGVRDLRESPALAIIGGLLPGGRRRSATTTRCCRSSSCPAASAGQPGDAARRRLGPGRGAHTAPADGLLLGLQTARGCWTPPTSSSARRTARWCEAPAMLTDLREADVTTPAVVLKLDPNMLHHGGLGVIRSLGRLGVPVYGVHEGRWAPAASSRYLAGRVFWQPPPDDADRIIAGLLELAGRIGRPAVLLPTDDAGAIFLAEQGGPLRDSFLFPRPARGPAPAAGRQVLAVPAVPRPRGAQPAGHAGLVGRARPRTSRPTAGFPVIAKLTTPVAGRRVRTGRAAAAQHHDHPRPGRAGRGLAALHRGRAGPDAAGVPARRARPGLVLPRLLRRRQAAASPRSPGSRTGPTRRMPG